MNGLVVTLSQFVADRGLPRAGHTLDQVVAHAHRGGISAVPSWDNLRYCGVERTPHLIFPPASRPSRPVSLLVAPDVIAGGILKVWPANAARIRADDDASRCDCATRPSSSQFQGSMLWPTASSHRSEHFERPRRWGRPRGRPGSSRRGPDGRARTGQSAASVIADGHDVGDASSCSRGAESNEFGAWAAREVVEVHAHECASVSSSHRRAHRVNANAARAGIGGGINRSAGKFDKLILVGRERPGGAGQGLGTFLHGRRTHAGDGSAQHCRVRRAILPM